MYAAYFGLTEPPFSISPDPRYLYTSSRHQEAMAHLMYGVREGGGFVQLTGEVGTGKTTLCRWLLEQVPDDLDVALILNPRCDEHELLAAICDELRIRYPAKATPKKLLDLLNKRLLDSYAKGRRTMLIIDEAQLLSKSVLEQVRLLTNLETVKQKLLQIILIGQPELNTTLARPDLQQLAQRVTARYHLGPLSAAETDEYIRFRLAIAGGKQTLFANAAARLVHRYAGGVPRLINVICDRALLGAYSAGDSVVGAATVRKAAREVLGGGAQGDRRIAWFAAAAGVLLVAAVAWFVRPIETPVWKAPAVLTALPEQSQTVPSDPERNTTVAQHVNDPAGVASPRAGEPAEVDQTSAVEPTEPVAMPSPDPITVAQQAKTDPGSALNALLSYWGVQFSDNGLADCGRVTEIGFACLRSRGSWNNLRNLNRAVILTLRGPDRDHHVLVTRMDDPNQVTILVNNTAHRFALEDIDRYWYGEYLLLWRPPPLISHPIARHSRGADVLWLRQALSRVDDQGPAFDVANPEFDQQLYDRIIGFQRRNSLDADGIVGVETLIKLNSYLRDGDTPFLVPPTG